LETENRRRLCKEEEVFGQITTNLSGWQCGLLSAFSKTVGNETHIRKGEAENMNTHRNKHTEAERFISNLNNHRLEN